MKRIIQNKLLKIKKPKNPWNIKVSRINRSSKLSKREIQKMYKEIVEKGQGDNMQWRRGFHPTERISIPKVKGKNLVSVKGGFLIGSKNKISQTWKKDVEQRVMQGKQLEKHAHGTGEYGFMHKRYALKEYKTGNLFFKKCPEVMANYPVAMIEFKNIHEVGVGTGPFAIKRGRQAAVIEAVPEKGIRANVVSELMMSGKYDRAFQGMIDSMVAISSNEEIEHLKKYKKQILSEGVMIKGQKKAARFFVKEMIQFQPSLHKNVVNETRRNLLTVYEKTGLIPDVAYGLKDVTARGKLADYSDFQKATTKKQAMSRIDEILNMMNRNFRLNKASMERLA